MSANPYFLSRTLVAERALLAALEAPTAVARPLAPHPVTLLLQGHKLENVIRCVLLDAEPSPPTVRDEGPREHGPESTRDTEPVPTLSTFRSPPPAPEAP